MYLSKISLQPSARTAVELAKLSKNGAYSAHQLLWSLFPEDKYRNFLFRQEIGDGGMPFFYVLSESVPDESNWLFYVQSKCFNPILNAGKRLAYKLRANPTICIYKKDGKSQRHDVLMHTKYQYKNEPISMDKLGLLMNSAAQEWLADHKRLEAWGITLDVVPEVQAYSQHISKKSSKQNIQFSSVDYEGILTIKDPKKFMQQYIKGFGRAKALGCGLMLIRSV